MSNHWYKKLSLWGLGGLIAIALFTSCKNDPYETGESDLAYLRSDFTDITIKNGIATNAVTDDDVTLILPSGTTYTDATDTVIRRLLSYYMPSALEAITLNKSTNVYVSTPHDTSEVKTMHTDPVKLSSAWVSHNKKYINMQLGIMMGNADSDAKQSIAFICDSISTIGRGAIYLTLYHDQAGYEQYYTEDVYVSLPMNSLVPVLKGKPVSSVQPDTVNITVNTYSGKQTKQFLR